jgi:hypothetical protein
MGHALWQPVVAAALFTSAGLAILFAAGSHREPATFRKTAETTPKPPVEVEAVLYWMHAALLHGSPWHARDGMGTLLMLSSLPWSLQVEVKIRLPVSGLASGLQACMRSA